MSDQPDSPNTTPPGRKNQSIFYIILLLLLLGVNIYLYIRNTDKNETIQVYSAKVDADSTRIADLDMKYQESLVTIESYKGQNSQLDSIIAIKERELLDLRSSYTSLQKQKKLTEAEYKKQINAIESIVADLQNQITLLQQQNQVLISKNDSLGKTLAAQLTANTELTSANQLLATQANLLRPTSITGTGIRIKSGGKEDETDNARKAEKLKICWNLPDNDVAGAGEKVFYIRIISPEGVTLNLESSGSGVITRAGSAEQIQYTMSHTVMYDQRSMIPCAYWEQSSPYAKGTYTTEIYQDGYLVGLERFELR